MRYLKPSRSQHVRDSFPSQPSQTLGDRTPTGFYILGFTWIRKEEAFFGDVSKDGKHTLLNHTTQRPTNGLR